MPQLKNIPISCLVFSILRTVMGKMGKVLNKQLKTFHLAVLPIPFHYSIYTFKYAWWSLVQTPSTFFFFFPQRTNPRFLTEFAEDEWGSVYYTNFQTPLQIEASSSFSLLEIPGSTNWEAFGSFPRVHFKLYICLLSHLHF